MFPTKIFAKEEAERIQGSNGIECSVTSTLLVQRAMKPQELQSYILITESRAAAFVVTLYCVNNHEDHFIKSF